MNVIRRIARLARRYERILKYTPERMMENRKTHIEQLKGLIEASDELLDIVADDIRNWSSAVEAVYAVDEFDNVFQKIEYWFLKKYSEYYYTKAITESETIGYAKTTFENVLRRLQLVDAFRRW